MDHSPTGLANRQRLLLELGLDQRELFTVTQRHSDTVVDADSQPTKSPGDAIIALESNAVIAVGVADCPAVLLYDPATGARAAVHSGWRGTEKNIVTKTVSKLTRGYGVEPQNLWAWISPAAQQRSYEVEKDVACLFDGKYLQQKNDVKSLLDVQRAVYDQLIECGLTEKHIERNTQDTITGERFHSCRRSGGNDYGLMLAFLAINQSRASWA